MIISIPVVIESHNADINTRRRNCKSKLRVYPQLQSTQIVCAIRPGEFYRSYFVKALPGLYKMDEVYYGCKLHLQR